jgi:hypothetical protein
MSICQRLRLRQLCCTSLELEHIDNDVAPATGPTTTVPAQPTKGSWSFDSHICWLPGWQLTHHLFACSTQDAASTRTPGASFVSLVHVGTCAHIVVNTLLWVQEENVWQRRTSADVSSSQSLPPWVSLLRVRGCLHASARMHTC